MGQGAEYQPFLWILATSLNKKGECVEFPLSSRLEGKEGDRGTFKSKETFGFFL